MEIGDQSPAQTNSKQLQTLPLLGGGHTSSLLKYGLYRVTSNKFKMKRQEKKSNFTVGKPDKHYHSQVIKVNINSDKSY